MTNAVSTSKIYSKLSIGATFAVVRADPWTVAAAAISSCDFRAANTFAEGRQDDALQESKINRRNNERAIAL